VRTPFTADAFAASVVFVEARKAEAVKRGVVGEEEEVVVVVVVVAGDFP
jgi:hypothetical protein